MQWGGGVVTLHQSAPNCLILHFRQGFEYQRNIYITIQHKLRRIHDIGLGLRFKLMRGEGLGNEPGEARVQVKMIAAHLSTVEVFLKAKFAM